MTCRQHVCGSTRNDTVFMHPRVAEMISDMSVPEDKKFDVHTPLLVDFSLAREHEKKDFMENTQHVGPFLPCTGDGCQALSTCQL